MKRMNKILSIILSVVMIIGILPMAQIAELDLFAYVIKATAADEVNSGTCGDNLTWELDDKGYLTISGKGKMTDFKLDYWSQIVSSPWYDVRLNIKAVIFGAGVQTVGEYAFYKCDNLRSVIFSDTIIRIKSFAFYACAALSNLTLPANLISMDHYVFEGCSSLAEINIPSSLVSLGTMDFANCPQLACINVEEGNASFRSIDNCLVEIDNKEIVLGCKNSIIPATESVLSIGDWAFSGCGLVSVFVPSNIKYVGRGAFESCERLKEVHLDFGVEKIEEQAFEACGSLEIINIPNSVLSIGEDAFKNTAYYNADANWDYDGLYINNHLIKAKRYYNYNDSYDDIYEVRNNTISIASRAFSYVYIDEVVLPSSLQAIGEYAFDDCRYLKKALIPDGIIKIGDYAFDDCDNLCEISIPDSVCEIGCYVFNDTLFYQNDDNWIDDVLYINNHLIKAKSDIVGDYVIRNGTKTISPYAFYGCGSLSNIVIPNGVIYIGDQAFNNCSGLTSVYIPDTVSSIGMRAFSYCSNMVSINIPTGIKDLPLGIFCGCSALENIVFPNNLVEIGGSAFEGCSSLSEIIVPNSVEIIGGGAFSDCIKLQHFIIPEKLKFISAYMFKGCKKLINVEFQGSVSLIGAYAFYETGIDQLLIPDGTKAILQQAFAFSKIKSITIPDSVQWIDEYAFYECNNLNQVDLGSEYKYVDAYAFRCCFYINTLKIGSVISDKTVAYLFPHSFNKLQSVVISDNVINLSENAFAGCSSVKSLQVGKIIEQKTIKDLFPNFYDTLNTVVISDSTINICENAFWGCSSLRDISIPDSVESIGKNAFEGTPWYNYKGNGIVYAGRVAYKYKGYMSNNAHITIANDTKSISAYAFDGLNQLASVTIPNSVKAIEEAAFKNCYCLSDIYYQSNEISWNRISIKISNEALYSASMHYYSTGPEDNHHDEYDNFADQNTINEELKDYTVIAGILDSYVLSVVLNAEGKSYVSEFTLDGNSYTVAGDEVADSDVVSLEGEPIFIALKNNEIVWFAAVEDYIGEEYIEIQTPTFKYSVNQNRYVSNTTGDVVVKISNPLTTLKFVQAAPGYSQSIFTTNAFKVMLENCLKGSDIGAIHVKKVNLISDGTCINAVDQADISDTTLRVCETVEYIFSVSAVNHPGLNIDSAYNFDRLTAEFVLQDNTKIAESSYCKIMNTDYRSSEKPWERTSPGSGDNGGTNTNEVAYDAAKKLSTMAVTLQGDISQSLSKLFTQTQLDAIANTLLTEVAMYKAPKETFSESLSNKIIEKVFKCNTKLFWVSSYEIACTFAVNTKWGLVQVQFTCGTTDYALNSNRYAFNADIYYKVVSGAERLPSDINLEGFAGGLVGANMEAFCKAVWSVAQSELKSAYNKAYGDDLNSAVDLIFGKSVNKVLSQTKYGNVSGLYWKMLTTPSTSITINCPVDVYVYNSNNELVASIVHNGVGLSTDNAIATVEDGVKHLHLFCDEYQVEYVPIADGTMDLKIENYGFSDGLIDVSDINNIPLSVEKTYLQDVDSGYNAESALVLNSTNGESISIDEYLTVFHEHISDGVVYHTDYATCTQEGLTWGYCTVCNEYYIDRVESTLEHAWDDGVITKAAKCDEEGVLTYTCVDCGATKTEPIEMIAHTEVAVIGKAATCTEPGLTDGVKCSECDTIITAQKTIPAIGHKYGDWTVVKSPTCTENGTEQRVCTNDAYHVETRAISATGHQWSAWTVVSEPTCTATGLERRVCLNDTSHIETREIGRLEHTDANEDGFCDECGHNIGSDPVEQESNCVCGKYHSGPFAGIIKFFHKIIYFFKNLFNKN